MFSDKKEKTSSIEPGTGQNRINEGTSIKGDINTKGFIRIDGTIDGNVTTSSKVVIGKAGTIKGILSCENADIEGTFKGDLKVTGTLTLRTSAKIEGDVIAGKLAVEPGAIFNASCTMGDGREDKNTESNYAVIKEETQKNHPFNRQQRAKKTSVEQSG